MGRVSRLLIITGVMLFLGMSSLYFVARQFENNIRRETRPADGVATAPGKAEIPIPPFESLASGAGASDEQRRALLRKIEVFAHVRASLVEELKTETGSDQASTRLAELLTAEDMGEEEYRAIRTWYRNWLSGEGEVEPSWRWAFDNSPAEVMERADMGVYDKVELTTP
jgi:hypothetical protein